MFSHKVRIILSFICLILVLQDGGNLVIRNVQLMHAGEYTCVAQTTVDRAETSAQIDVRGMFSVVYFTKFVSMMWC